MLRMIRNYPELILFGILTALFSSPGQTFLASLFVPAMRQEFGLSQTAIAGLFSLATLFSAFLLPWTGKVIDRFHLMRFTVFCGALLALGCLLLGIARNAAVVFLGYFLIRNIGQGTLVMISTTTMARVFGHMRGKALGISNLGYPLGEALFPPMVSAWIMALGWRSGWLILMMLILAIFIPATIYLLKNDPHVNAQKLIEKEIERNAAVLGKNPVNDWTVPQVLQDFRFYLLLFSLMIPPMFLTGLFFHQIHLAAWKHWGVSTISAGFVGYGLCRAFVSFWIGPMIDRYSARRIFPINLIPFAVGLLVYLAGEAPIWSFVYLGLTGMSIGLSMTVSSALYVELYGTKDLGAIRGVIASLVVLTTAAAPVLLGILIDADINPKLILEGMLVCTLIGSVCAWLACRLESKVRL